MGVTETETEIVAVLGVGSSPCYEMLPEGDVGVNSVISKLTAAKDEALIKLWSYIANGLAEFNHSVRVVSPWDCWTTQSTMQEYSPETLLGNQGMEVRREELGTVFIKQLLCGVGAGWGNDQV